MYEVELKFPLPPGDAADAVPARLAGLGAAFGEPVTQADTYYAHLVRDFAATDEALRVRVVTGPDGVPRGRLTYKGPKLPGAAKTREEYEPHLADGADHVAALRTALGRLGFREVLTVTKTRRVAALTVPDDAGTPREYEVTRDEVEGLGTYLEVETIADEATLDAAKAGVLALADRLGLGAVERRSYLGMLLDAAGAPTAGG